MKHLVSAGCVFTQGLLLGKLVTKCGSRNILRGFFWGYGYTVSVHILFALQTTNFASH